MSAPHELPENQRAAEAIEAKASEWLARQDRGLSAEERVAFARWRGEDARHEAAVTELMQVWVALDDLTARQAKVIDIRSGREKDEEQPRHERRTMAATRKKRMWPGLAMAASIAILLGAMVWQRTGSGAGESARHETVVGAQRTISLPDGSTVTLNTNSSLFVRFSSGVRAIELERGEAFFTVTKDATRPFVVSAHGVESRAIGTAFVVRCLDKGAELLVTDGKVRFGEAADVGLRQLAVVEKPGAMPRVSTLDEATLNRRVAWRRGWLEFQETPLAVAVAEFNRYHGRQLLVADAATAAVPFSGGFEIDNLDGFVRLLDSSFNVASEPRNSQTLVLRLKRRKQTADSPLQRRSRSCAW
jgi:transmembrane sensor